MRACNFAYSGSRYDKEMAPAGPDVSE